MKCYALVLATVRDWLEDCLRWPGHNIKNVIKFLICWLDLLGSVRSPGYDLCNPITEPLQLESDAAIS